MPEEEQHAEKLGWPGWPGWPEPQLSQNEESTGEEPYVVKYVRRGMEDAFQLDTKLLDKFFPLPSDPSPGYQTTRKELFNETKNRWKGIPTKPTPFTRIYTPLTRLFNRILFNHGIRRDERLFIDSHVRRHKSNPEVLAGISLVGVGVEFANSSEPLPRDQFSNCITAIEVVPDSDDMRAARDRLAVHMHWIFNSQDNRRFAFGLVITPNIFTVYIFDHSGAVASEPCNYHLEPARFCAVISGLGAKGGGPIGFDRTVLGGEDMIFRSLQTADDGSTTEIKYLTIDCLFRFPFLVGRGTMCWLTARLDDPHSLFVIKDAWIAPSDPPGRESEASLLRHVQSRGIDTGVVKIHHCEEVRRSDDPLDLDTVLRNRKIDDTSTESLKLDRVHTRLVMTPCGKTLDEFSNRRELLLAFHDAVLAHRKLHDVAGILHRDISCRNILINPDGVEGDRGILIDFDHSIRIADTSPYATKPGIGTWRFRSRGVLQGHVPHTYLDDLESFYYVLCWILGAFESVGVIKEELPDDLNFWDLPASYEMKTGYLMGEFDMDISPYFGKALPALASCLHYFIGDRLWKPELAKQEPNKGYDEYISYIQQAITDLENEEREAAPDASGCLTKSEVDPARVKPNTALMEVHKKPAKASRRSALVYRSSSPTPKDQVVSLGRPRRSKANYGYPSVHP